MSIGKTLVGIGLIGGVTVASALYLTGVVGLNNFPEWHPLSSDSEYKTQGSDSSNGYKGKYGETYSKYFVGKDNKNDFWWEWSYQNRYLSKKEEIKDKFKNLQKDELKNKCIEAYKDSIESNNTGNIKTSVTDNDTNKFLESNIWLFCSPAEEKIETIADKNSSDEYSAITSTYGQTEENKKLLVSVISNSKGNNWFWNKKERELGNDDKAPLNNKTVKNWCKDIYKQSTAPTDTTNLSKDNLFKYCSLSGTTPSNG